MNQTLRSIAIHELIQRIETRRHGIECNGLAGSERAYLIARLHRALGAPLLVVVPDLKASERLGEDIAFFTGGKGGPISHFPPYPLMPSKVLSSQNGTAARRLGTLYELVAGETAPIVIAPAESLRQKILPKKEMTAFAELLMAGEEVERDSLVRKLITGGYTRAILVEEPGDFCVRGGILDIFSPQYPDPLRVEFFGDTIDSLRFFSAVNQRTLRSVDEAVILPAREAILRVDRLDTLFSRIRLQAADQGIKVSRVRDFIHRIKKEGSFAGIERLLPLLYDDLDTLLDYLPPHALLVQVEPGEMGHALRAADEKAAAIYRKACEEDRFCVSPGAAVFPWPAIRERADALKPLTLRLLPVAAPGGDGPPPERYAFQVADNRGISMEIKERREREHLLAPLADWIRNNREAGVTTVLVCSTSSQTARLQSLLAPYPVQLQVTETLPKPVPGAAPAYLSPGKLSNGFAWPGESLAIITEDEIFGAKRRRRAARSTQAREDLLSLGDLTAGDLVVHTEHGIGRYEGLVKLNTGGITNDFLQLVYRDDDKLYLPVDRMNMVQRYIGMDDAEPLLDKMGGKSWDQIKKKVKRSVEKIAGELLKLYAARKVHTGHAFSVTDEYFKDFEAGFPYEETADQLKAIEDVLADMESPLPMDRLVCGDVGYGKTEVALRAAFRAVGDGKQVAVLVPTTILAEQHFATFSARFQPYPVTVACLNRFRSAAEQRHMVADLKAGRIDIVIGTHRLLQKDVGFKDLGLIVIDEEQRFGVKHKEKLKSLRSTVDVLALTATPIPRTMHLSLMGVRDISVISTPPEERHAIVTYISEFDETVVAEAVRRELGRGGQIFFVHNNIHSIFSMAKKLKEIVPEVRLGVVHGRLPESELEQVMMQFINQEIDMLVTTSIIESGLDIPAANTMLINRADRFGLAQIYQLRGRIGRASEQAYAYLFLPEESLLGKDAQKRLKVLLEYSDLGSGFQIAMSDLKIRGGGTILGASQSGHIAAVGYDMFLKLMDQAVRELKGEHVVDELDPEINVSMSAFLPEAYVPDIDQRLTAYRRLARMAELKEIADFKAELIDRFGPLPVEAGNLLMKIMLKILSREAGVKRLDLTDHQITLHFSEIHQKNPLAVVDLVAGDPRRCILTPDGVLKATLKKAGTGGLMAQVKILLKEISQHVNG